MTSLQNVSKVFHFYFLDLVIYSHILKVKRNKREKQVSFPCPSTPALVRAAPCCTTGLSWVTMYLGICSRPAPHPLPQASRLHGIPSQTLPLYGKQIS